jgi:hypothetical protein
MTVKNVNKTINITSVGFSTNDQLDNALESPIDKKKNCLKILENTYIIMKDLNILYLLKINI